ncbi:Uncharacterised protein [Vibrio cholerae]|uniref:Uncharacterized protein n=1 Tax=Vibrio cholerae TaxID=666 RepID=A0A655SR62_VIBCL|nr:Uncharacterised protein [Vibrio cholerae]CSA09093.1 Uncharacterised protein [Vibrio cholerae]CSA88004.1 Uncharacterised protein [Vibrio cholerae]CSB20947.1 Uncharacterised protein [Vibrio cholerae]CSB25903.1 Uncharacterised protein [Vibrio cholerae]
MVVMMIFLPFSNADFSSDDLNAGATMFFTSENSFILSRNCLSSNRRSVTTMTESNRGISFPLLPGRSSLIG